MLRHSPKRIMWQLGATQSQLAMLLNISSTAIFNATRRLGKTPRKALLLLKDLSDWLHEAEQKVAARPSAAEPVSQLLIRSEKGKCLIALSAAQRKLIGMEYRYQKYANALRHLEEIQIPETHADHLLIRRWMDSRKAEAQVRLRECNKEKQFAVRRRIAELEGAIAWLDTLIEPEPSSSS
jgi:hypothetical protein